MRAGHSERHSPLWRRAEAPTQERQKEALEQASQGAEQERQVFSGEAYSEGRHSSQEEEGVRMEWEGHPVHWSVPPPEQDAHSGAHGWQTPTGSS